MPPKNRINWDAYSVRARYAERYASDQVPPPR